MLQNAITSEIRYIELEQVCVCVCVCIRQVKVFGTLKYKIEI